MRTHPASSEITTFLLQLQRAHPMNVLHCLSLQRPTHTRHQRQQQHYMSYKICTYGQQKEISNRNMQKYQQFVKQNRSRKSLDFVQRRRCMCVDVLCEVAAATLE
eukprot:m.29705 g.29705  ORF g.29705 m.29705 type:complete len:105 (-) comp9197_c0_seq1:1400-1714(-)